MSLPLPNLDNRRFDDLFEEMKSYIHRYAPEWTDHNLSDPGITILEALVWLSEVVMYRANQIPEESITNFLSIIRGGLDGMTGTQDEEIEKALMDLEQRYRAITASDYEELVAKCSEEELTKAEYKYTVKRSVCIANRNLEYESANEAGHISVIVFLEHKTDPDIIEIEEIEKCKSAIDDYLNSRRLIATRVHIVSPKQSELYIDFDIELAPKSPEKTDLIDNIKENLDLFLHPITGGYDSKGWPLGRDVYIADIYKIIEETSGVEHTKWAKIIPSEQILQVSLTDEIEFKDSFKNGSRIIQYDTDLVGANSKEIRSYSTIEKINSGEGISEFLLRGFSSDELVTLMTNTLPKKTQWFKVLSISTNSEEGKWKTMKLQAVNPVDESITFPAGSMIKNENGTIFTSIEKDITFTGDEEVIINVNGLIEGRTLYFFDHNGVLVEFKKGDIDSSYDVGFSSFQQYTDRMVLEIPAVPKYTKMHNQL